MGDQANKPAFSWGAAPTSGSPATGLFGGGSTPASSAPGGSLFGAANTTTGGGLFGSAGKKPEDNNKPSIFGTPNKPSTPNPDALSTPANGQNAPGKPSTTPMFSPPATSGGLFGQSTGGGTSMFGNASGSQAASTATPASGGLFGGAPSNPPKPAGGLFGGQTNTSSPSPFGQASSTPGGGLFGQKPTDSQPPQDQNKTATASTSLFASQASAPKSDQNAKPGLFGSATSSTAPSTATTAKPLFGAAPANFASAQAASSGSTPSTLFPATSSTSAQPATPFGSGPKADAPSSNAQTSGPGAGATSAPSTDLFGTPQTTSKSQSSQAPSSFFGGLNKTTTTSAPASGGGLFGPGPASSLPATSTATTVAGNAPSSTATGQPSGSTATGGTAGQAANATPAFGSSTAGPTPTPQSRLKNKTMDEIITRWATDLKKYQKEFQTQADKVAQWDRLLVENSNAITKLYSRTFQAERDTAEVQKQLSAVEDNQAELTQWLDRYELEVEELMAKEGMGQREGLQGPDQERERTYKAAERVQEKLGDMGNELTGLIDEINSVSNSLSNSAKPDDPLSQIVRVLNNHLSQLQQIDQDTAALQAKVTAAKVESQRLGYRSNGVNNAADDFYRSIRSGR